MDIGEIFFRIATINNQQHILLKDDYKNIILNSFNWLSETGKIDVFGFVIMPNHIHLMQLENPPPLAVVMFYGLCLIF